MDGLGGSDWLEGGEGERKDVAVEVWLVHLSDQPKPAYQRTGDGGGARRVARPF